MLEVNVGEFILSIRLNTSIRYTAPPDGEDEEKVRHDRAGQLVDIREHQEQAAALNVMEALGWDEDRIKKAQRDMAHQAEEARRLEEEGRKEKHAARRRARL